MKPELVSFASITCQVQLSRKQVEQYMLIKNPEVDCAEIDKIVRIKEEARQLERSAVELLGYMLENGVYME